MCHTLGLLVLGYWVGVLHPFHFSIFLTASHMVLPQDASTKVCRTLPLETRYRNSPTGAPMQYLRGEQSHCGSGVRTLLTVCRRSVPPLNGNSGTVEHAQTSSRNRPPWPILYYQNLLISAALGSLWQQKSWALAHQQSAQSKELEGLVRRCVAVYRSVSPQNRKASAKTVTFEHFEAALHERWMRL